MNMLVILGVFNFDSKGKRNICRNFQNLFYCIGLRDNITILLATFMINEKHDIKTIAKFWKNIQREDFCTMRIEYNLTFCTLSHL